MNLNTLQILALIVTFITALKLMIMITKRNSFKSLLEAYKNSISANSWLYFSIYTGLSIFILYLIRTTGVSYTEILAVCMFVGMLMNAALIGMNLFPHYDLDKVNWRMIAIYTLIFLFVMFKSLQEIFNF